MALLCEKVVVVIRDFCGTSCACDGNRALRAREMAMLSRHEWQTVCKLFVLSMVAPQYVRLSRNSEARKRKFAASSLCETHQTSFDPQGPSNHSLDFT
jgi:hypothetical protein